jgi:hypothetical protein
MFAGRWIALGVVALLGASGAAYGIHSFVPRDADDADDDDDRPALVQRQPEAPAAGGAAASVAFRRVGAAKQVEKGWNFDQDQTGKIASGWTNVTGTWEVVADDTAPSKPNTLAQVSKNHTGGYFNVAVADEPSLKDVDISVRSRAMAGQEDQGGGVVWRYRDIRNYYIARQNNLEDNFRVYHVLNGRRIQTGTADVRAQTGAWHQIRVTMTGDHIQCYFDGKKYLDVHDDTFKDAGKVGLWSKSDAQSHFDDFRVSGD